VQLLNGNDIFSINVIAITIIITSFIVRAILWCWMMRCTLTKFWLMILPSLNQYMLLLLLIIVSFVCINQRSSGRMLIWSSRRVNSLIILVIMLTCSWVCVLIEVHENILYLSLLWWIHYHNNGLSWSWSYQVRCCCACYRLMINKLITTSSIVLCCGRTSHTTSIMCIESVWGWACSSLLVSLLLVAHKITSSNTATCWGLPFRGSLLLMLLLILLVIIIWKVCVSSILLLLLIPIITSKEFPMLIHELLANGQELLCVLRIPLSLIGRCRLSDFEKVIVSYLLSFVWSIIYLGIAHLLLLNIVIRITCLKRLLLISRNTFLVFLGASCHWRLFLSRWSSCTTHFRYCSMSIPGSLINCMAVLRAWYLIMRGVPT